VQDKQTSGNYYVSAGFRMPPPTAAVLTKPRFMREMLIRYPDGHILHIIPL
jgi:hypothetical protein